jgi:hypothetical protein
LFLRDFSPKVCGEHDLAAKVPPSATLNHRPPGPLFHRAEAP